MESKRARALGAADPEPAVTGLRRIAPRSFRATIVASTVGLMTVAMAVVVVGIQLVLGYTAQHDIRQVLQDRSSAMITVITQASASRLTVPPEALEPGMVVYDAEGRRLAGSVESEGRAAADDLALTDRARSVQGASDDVRLLGTPFTTPSGESGVLVVSQEAGPYERSELYALVATIALGVLVIGATGVITLRVTRQALRPVARMAERAADWSEHDLSHRFALGPPTNELAALGETLDHLLDRVASAIRSEQRLTAELAHELRTPLTAIQGSADLALLRGVDDDAVAEDLRQISTAAREMAGVIATLLDVAREGARASREQGCVLADVVPALLALEREGIELVDATGGSTARIAAPAGLVARAVSPVVMNAVQHARRRVLIEAVDHPDRVDLIVDDDGPGVPADLGESLFEPGVSRREGGAGLGLGIARRVVHSLGGDVALDANDGQGARFRFTLPTQ